MKTRSALPLYVAGIVLGGFLLFFDRVTTAIVPAVYSEAEFWILAFAVIAGEFIRIEIAHGRETSVVTVGDPFTLALLFSFGLGPALIVKVIASLIDDASRRQVWWKALFNAGQFSLTLGAAYMTAMLASGESALIRPLEAHDILPTLLAAGVYFFVNIAILNGAMSIWQKTSLMSTLRNSLKDRVINQGTLLGFTPVVVGALDHSVWLFPFLLIPIVAVYHSGLMTHRHMVLAEQITELYEATRLTSAPSKSQHSFRELLERVCRMFEGTRASITIFPRADGESGVRTTLDVDDGTFVYADDVDLDPTQGIWARVASEDQAMLVARPIENARLLAHFTELGVKDLMAAPMHSEGAVIGFIECFNHTGSKTFENEDLKLFETFANHASIVMQNARLIEDLEDSLAHLTEMNQLKDDFVASVSHELRTPLTSIRGYVRTLLRPDANFAEDDQRSFLETIDRQSTRLHRLIEDLLAVSRIESETDSSTLSAVSIRQLAEDVADELRAKAADHQIELYVSTKIPVIQTDVGKVHQIVTNLVDNALKYTPAGTSVVVTAETQAGGVTISVSDQGTGIPADVQDKIFDRFYQVDQSATRSVGGAGLGLYICRRMAEALGGRVWLEKSDGEGSTFSLWIPTNVKTPHSATTSV
jgi:signal transduction histidine kinase